MSEIVTSSDFQSKVLDAQGPVLVDFFATWCGPCKMLAPTIDEVAGETAGEAAVYKLDIDQSPDIAQRYGVMSVPTLMVFENGAGEEAGRGRATRAEHPLDVGVARTRSKACKSARACRKKPVAVAPASSMLEGCAGLSSAGFRQTKRRGSSDPRRREGAMPLPGMRPGSWLGGRPLGFYHRQVEDARRVSAFGKVDVAAPLLHHLLDLVQVAEHARLSHAGPHARRLVVFRLRDT